MLGFVINYYIEGSQKPNTRIILASGKTERSGEVSALWFDKARDTISAAGLAELDRIDPGWREAKGKPVFKEAGTGKRIPLMSEWSERAIRTGSVSYEDTERMIRERLQGRPEPTTFYDVMEARFFDR